jgi:hypothetical protein
VELKLRPEHWLLLGILALCLVLLGLQTRQHWSLEALTRLAETVPEAGPGDDGGASPAAPTSEALPKEASTEGADAEGPEPASTDPPATATRLASILSFHPIR